MGERARLGSRAVRSHVALSWEAKLTINPRVAEIENQIGAGLIEEVIQVAEGELKLVDEMSKSKV